MNLKIWKNMSKKVIRLKEIIEEIKKDKELLVENNNKKTHYNNVKKQ